MKRNKSYLRIQLTSVSMQNSIIKTFGIMFCLEHVRILAIMALILFISFIHFSCGIINEPVYSGDFPSQIKTDFGTAIVKSDGSLWGNGPYMNGNWSIPGSVNVEKLNRINGIKNIVSIDLYSGMSIAADLEGNIWYWGCNTLSSTMSPQILEPQKISFLQNIKSMNIDQNTIRILAHDGNLWYIPLNISNPFQFQNPLRFNNLSNIKQISGQMALKDDGKLIAFQNIEPEYGGFIPEMKNIIDFDNVWYRRTVILKNDGTVWSWGKNSLGELGNGTYTDSSMPTQVTGLSDIIDISANYDFNLALKNDGTVWFWGFAGYNQDNKPFGYSTPFKIENLKNVKIICAGILCYFMLEDGSFHSFDQRTNKLSNLVFAER
jgi:alpha-tubulin suppressor-like RCC1 family protein